MISDDVNQREWNDPKNWASGLYCSRTDKRMIVPIRRSFGVTINFGNRKAVILFVALLALPLVVCLVLYLCGVHLNRH